MTCLKVPMPDGSVAIVCSRGGPSACAVQGDEAVVKIVDGVESHRCPRCSKSVATYQTADGRWLIAGHQ